MRVRQSVQPEDSDGLQFNAQYTNDYELNLTMSMIEDDVFLGSVLLNEDEVTKLVTYLLDLLTEAEKARMYLDEDSGDYYGNDVE